MSANLLHPNKNESISTGLPLSELILAKLLERIYDGRLAQGAPINEAIIATEFGVSRGPVREAVRRLQGLQLVTRSPYLKAKVVVLTKEGVQELFEIRMALEGVACRLAAERMSKKEIVKLIDELELSQQQSLEKKQSSQKTFKTFDFHERIVRGCQNDRIIDTLCGDLYHLLRMYRYQSGSIPERKKQAYAEHWQIARVMLARDGDLAESLMRSHISRASQHLLDQVVLDSTPTRVT